MKTAKATKGQPEFDAEIRVPRFIWRVTRAWHPVKNDEEGLKILWAGQQKLLEAFDLQFPDQRQPARGLYTAPHDPADSGGLRRTPADFAGLRRTPADSYSGLCWCDMGQLRISSPGGVRRSPPESVESARLRRTQPGLSPVESTGLSPVESTGVQCSSGLHRTPVDSTGLHRTPAGLNR